MKKKIYIFGNPLVEIDFIPLKIVEKLKDEFPDVVFEAVDPNENFPPDGEKDLIILDTVMGIKEPTLLDLNDFDRPGGRKKTPISPHDYDLLLHLLLLRKMRKIEKVRIIGIPAVHLRGAQSRAYLKSILDKIHSLERL